LNLSLLLERQLSFEAFAVAAAAVVVVVVDDGNYLNYY
jgi:hypothetical protein